MEMFKLQLVSFNRSRFLILIFIVPCWNGKDLDAAEGYMQPLSGKQIKFMIQIVNGVFSVPVFANELG